MNLFEGLEDWEDGSPLTLREKVNAFLQAEAEQESIPEIEDAPNIEANLNGQNIREILGLSDKSAIARYYHNSVKCWPTDIEEYEDIVAQSPTMQVTLNIGETIIPTFKYLHQDLYLSLRKYRPEIVPEEEMHYSVKMNREILRMLFRTKEFAQLRRVCRMDPFNSAIGTEILGKKAMELVENFMDMMKATNPEQKELIDDLVKKEEEIDDLINTNEEIEELLKEMMAGEQEDGEQSAEALGEQLALNKRQIADAKALANALAERCADILPTTGKIVESMASDLASTMASAKTEIAQMADISYAWGLGGAGNNHIPFQNKKWAIEKIRNSSKLMGLTDMIGRFKETAITEQKKKVKDGAVELSSVTIGDRIQDILPSELMSLTHESLRPDFYRKQTEKQLLVYSKEAHKQKNKGPIIVCLDTSGSMCGDPEIWSKAVTIGIMEVAEMQKRDFACIIYSNITEKPIVIKKNEIAPEKVIEIATLFHGGGTDWASPLSEAMELIETATFKDADIVMITDGECRLSDQFLKKYKAIKEVKEFKTQGILVNTAGGYCSDKALKEFCDSVTLVSDLGDLSNSESDANKSIFGSL